VGTQLNFTRIRILILFAVMGVHAVVLLFAIFKIDSVPQVTETEAAVFKVIDIEEVDPRPPPPPPKETLVEETIQTITEAVAETMIETEKEPEPTAANLSGLQGGTAGGVSGGEPVDYYPMNRVSELPKFPEDKIRKNTVYPPLALRAGIQGIVYLELFVDKQGKIQDIRILRENPEGRGFGEAAVKAFDGISASSPARSNGQIVAVRYRYPVRFTIR
jgi:protein TonB